MSLRKRVAELETQEQGTVYPVGRVIKAGDKKARAKTLKDFEEARKINPNVRCKLIQIVSVDMSKKKKLKKGD